MPTGLVVNELLTNALKYAFVGRQSGTVTLHSVLEGNDYRVVVADDGIGYSEGAEWPKPGGLGVLILDTLRENVKGYMCAHHVHAASPLEDWWPQLSDPSKRFFGYAMGMQLPFR